MRQNRGQLVEGISRRDFGHNIKKKYIEVKTVLIGKDTVHDVGGMNALENAG